MVCPKCGSENVQVMSENVGSTTTGSTKSRGRGCLWTIGRWTLIICTCGLWLLVGKSKGKHKTKTTTLNEIRTVAICQNCANRWYPQ